MGLLESIATEAVSVFSNEFTEIATYTPAGGTARGVSGIFDRVSEVSDIGEYVEADGVTATFDVATVAVPGIAYGDNVAVRGYSYSVVGIEPDGTGRTVAVLGLPVPLRIDFDQTFTWVIDVHGTNPSVYGSAIASAPGGPYGLLTPITAGGIVVNRAVTNDDSDVVLVAFGANDDEKIPGVDSIEMTVFGGAATVLVWDDVQAWYVVIDQALSDLIISLEPAPSTPMTLRTL